MLSTETHSRFLAKEIEKWNVFTMPSNNSHESGHPVVTDRDKAVEEQKQFKFLHINEM